MTTNIILNIVLGILAVLATFVTYYFYIKGVITKEANGAINTAEGIGGEGEEKMRLAVEQIKALIPAFLKPIFPDEMIKGIVQEAFDKIEDYARKQISK